MDWVKQFTDMIFPLYQDLVYIEGAYNLKNQHLPKSIFKYRKVDIKSLKNLEEDTVWLADPINLNDPYDCAHTIDFPRLLQSPALSNKLIQEKGCDWNLSDDQKKSLAISPDPNSELMEIDLLGEPPEKRETVRDSFLSDIKKRHEDLAVFSSKKFARNFKLCSFSERNDSIVMWAHYASDHKGFCIEYDLEKIPCTDYRRRLLYPVIYSDQMFDATEHLMKEKGDKSLNFLRWHLAALVKARDWDYEKEWRLVFPHEECDSERTYVMGKPKMVYFGKDIPLDDEDQLTEICQRRKIPYAKMKPHHSMFKMVPYSL
ncbi:MAG: DUF2971 domain-containing protein [Chlorobium sp.]|nr:MAG: DUF2971 domain-containing protein [Chlorobium sp.]